MPVLDNPRWERFALLMSQGADSAEAYAAAGYRAKSRAARQDGACRLGKRPEVAQRIREFQENVAERTIAEVAGWLAEPLMGKTEVLARLQAMARLDLRKLAAWGGAAVAADGTVSLSRKNYFAFLKSSEIDAATASAIAEVTQGKDGTVRIKLHDKQAALRDYARLQGWLSEKHELTGPDGAPLSFTIKVGDDGKGRGGGGDGGGGGKD